VYSFYDVSKVAEVEELKATNKMYVTINSTVAHEMLTPLRCISEMVERLDDPSIDSNKKADFCRTIKYTSQLVQSQIKSSLDDGLLSLNMFKPQLGKYCVMADIIEPITNIFMTQLEPQQLSIEVVNSYTDDCFRKTDPKVFTDKLRVQQIIINLIRNSIKFAKPNDKITISLIGGPVQKNDIQTLSILVKD
jgi:signal transduction histidine kinase